jgi:acetylornithine deacetylase/succinyl-diaminopimelate desuccinylase-like protein
MPESVTRFHVRISLLVGLVVCALVAAAGQNRGDIPSSAPVDALAKSPAVRAALDGIRADEPQVTADQIRLCEIPAPPFQESARGQAMKSAFELLGLLNVRLDKAGNVIGDRPGLAPRPHLVVSAHLDTVFPEGTDVRVRRNGAVLTGPGVGDNCRGLAVLLAVARALRRANVPTDGPVTFVADVGEEGLGDLRGMKQLFGDTMKGQIDRFLSIDGSGLFLVNVAVGSRRYRVTFRGPGGHSYAAFGTANPIQAMGRAIGAISQLRLAARPKATFNVGRVGGGTSVNAIPTECWMEVDLRSADSTALAALDASVQRAVDEAVRAENQRWGTPGAITIVRELVGDRPPGRTPDNSAIVQTAWAAARALGLRPQSSESSTDANVPIQLGIPAITIGTGGRGTAPHTAGESFDTTDAWRGTQYAVLLVAALGARENGSGLRARALTPAAPRRPASTSF